jgi:hypothetical protein
VKRRFLQALGALAVLLIVVGIAAPFLSADRYRARIENALSLALGRKVEIGSVRLDLFTGPGFSASNVTIADTVPGAEPFIYGADLRAVPRLWSLWTGHLEFSSLTLEDAHVNLRRSLSSSAEPQWNFEPLLRPRLLATFPNIRLRGARINFKMGDVKNTFYLLDTDLDVSPRANDGTDWELRFNGEPARTDRPAHGFGAIAASGRWKQPPGGRGHLEFDGKLDRSEIGDMVTLVNGHDAGVHGLISGQVHVAGPIDAVGVEGEIRVSELHGWDQSPPSGGVFAFRVSGSADTVAQHLELFAEPRGGLSAVKAHLAADAYLQRPAWRFDLHSDALPVASLPGLFRNFGASIPEDLRLSGTMEGDLHYATADGWKGSGAVRDAALTIRNFPVLTFDRAALEVAGATARLMPVRMISGDTTIGTLAGNYAVNDGAFEVDLSSAGGPFAGLLKTFPVASVPLLSTLSSANWKGDLRFIQTASAPGRWTGSGELTEALAQIPALAEPLRIASASVQIDGDAIRIDKMRASAGAVTADCDYRYVPDADRPHQFRVTLQTADLAQLETLFRPTLQRSSNLFDLALTLGRATVPEWLRTMHADGSIQIGKLAVAGEELSRVRSRVQWDGPQIVFPDWQSRLARAGISGRINIDLRDTSPQYLATGKLAGMAWQGGELDGNVRVKTRGTGLDVITNLQMSGTFRGRDLTIEPLGLVDTLAGEGELSWSRDVPVFRFPQLRLASAGETWTGTGASRGRDGEVVFQLTGNGKQKSLAGSLIGPARGWMEQ